MNRRAFARASAGAILYTVAEAAPLHQAAAAGPNDQIGMGFIGVGIRGDFLHRAFRRMPGVKAIIAADLYDGYLTHAKEIAEGAIETTKDYRAVLDRKDIDAVTVATPDHWHRQIVLDALAAGKHVYCEKPMTWTIEQGREILAAVEKSGKILQVGSGGGNSPIARKAREIVQSGALGKVNMVRLANNRNTAEGAWVYPVPPDASEQTIDWARFQAPATKKSAFDPKVFFRWRCWWEYSGGVATDLFVHMLTMLHAVMDVPAPKSAVSQGGIYRWDDGRTVPDVMNTVYEYPNNFVADVYVNLGNSRSMQGVVLMGTQGTLVVEGYNRMVLYPEPVFGEAQRYAIACWPEAMRKQYYESLGYTAEGKPKNPLPASKGPQTIQLERGMSHQEEFIAALREGKPRVETALQGHYAAGAAHLANLAYRRGRRMQWDIASGKVKEA